jgi:4-amino-4-deoxy-L-arabinose transferase-like glycosyltransferase
VPPSSSPLVQAWNGRLAYLLLALFALALALPGIVQLPPTDRDEARFAQASKQMVETGNYVDIRYQNEARNKKPVGIYWLQAASANLFGKDRIWPYRLPSALGAIAAVLALATLARATFGREAGLLAGFFLAASLLLTVEAHIAKTDAVLLLTVVVAQLALARVYLAARAGEQTGLGVVLAFWLAQGAGILIKGPVTPLIAAPASAAVSSHGCAPGSAFRSPSWWRRPGSSPSRSANRISCRTRWAAICCPN